MGDHGQERVKRRHALVLSGGGAFAAYELGVLRALCAGESPGTEYTPIDPAIVTGTSAGSYNGAMFVSRWAMDPLEAIADMERVWLTEVAPGPCGSGVFRFRASPLDWINFRCFLESPQRFFWRRLEDIAFFTRSFADRTGAFWSSRAPIEERFLDLLNFGNLISTYPFPGLIRRTVDFREIRRSDVVFNAIATNWTTGEFRVFGNEDLDDTRGPLIIMASGSIPGVFPPVDIPPHVFVDGGVLMNTPLSPTIHAGATDVHVVYLDPEVPSIPVSMFNSTLSTLQRTLAISFAGIFDRDIKDAERINQAIERWERGAAGGAGLPGGGKATGRIAEIWEELSQGRKLRKVAIHRYRPRGLLGGFLGMLDFKAEQTKALIDRGYEDTVAHDCSEAGCVLPPGGPSEAPEWKE